MLNIKTHRFGNKKGQEYEIDLSLNDAAIMNDNLEVEVKGRYRNNKEENWTDEKFTVRLNAAEYKLEIVYKNKTVGNIDLDGIEGFFDDEFGDLETEEVWSQIKNYISDNGEAIEEIIQRIPAFDPVFGCLLKAGLSTSIGQILECCSQTRRLERAKQKIWAVLRCLGVNSLVMVSKFTFRTLKCAVMGGWDVV